MAKKENPNKTEESVTEQAPQQEEVEEKTPSPEEQLQEKLTQEHDNYLRLAAEYDNFRKRSQRERERMYTDVRAETIEKFLPVYDNLARALESDTTDEAFRKGVEMTMSQMEKILEGLGVEVFGQKGEAFDPSAHNAIMHLEDETLGENVVAEVLQKGFRIGEKVIRFAMVKVAN